MIQKMILGKNAISEDTKGHFTGDKAQLTIHEITE